MAKNKEEGVETVESTVVANQTEAAPAPKPKRFKVTMGTDVKQDGEYTARDKDEAFAMFCDSIRSWPGPKVAAVNGLEIVEV